MKSPYQQIVNFLNSNNVLHEVIDHEPVYTSEQAAKVRGLSLKEGAKSLLLKADAQFILAVLPGDRRLDSKKLKKELGVKNLRFAAPDEVKEVMGCEIGACYPFGNLLGMEMLVDERFIKNEMISFNPGVHDKSIKIKWEDYFRAVKPKMVNLSS